MIRAEMERIWCADTLSARLARAVDALALALPLLREQRELLLFCVPDRSTRSPFAADQLAEIESAIAAAELALAANGLDLEVQADG